MDDTNEVSLSDINWIKIEINLRSLLLGSVSDYFERDYNISVKFICLFTQNGYHENMQNLVMYISIKLIFLWNASS